MIGFTAFEMERVVQNKMLTKSTAWPTTMEILACELFRNPALVSNFFKLGGCRLLLILS